MPRSSADAELRRRELMKMLMSGQRIRTIEIANRFGVNPMTIRRDLNALSEAGVAIRSYGGAVAVGKVAFEFAFCDRKHLHVDEKRRIGVEAAKRIQPGQTVLVDTGTTAPEVARVLATMDLACTVATSSLVVAAELWSHQQTELILLGGRVRDGSPDLIGTSTEAALKQIKADVAFIGADAIDVEKGIYSREPHMARVVAIMTNRTDKVIIVADSTKLGRSEQVRYARIQDMDELITDSNADPVQVEALRKQGVEVTLV